MKIIYAGWGAEKTSNQTVNVQNMYNHGTHEFVASNNTWGDPDKGKDKALFIVWDDGSGLQSAAATEKGNVNKIVLP